MNTWRPVAATNTGHGLTASMLQPQPKVTVALERIAGGNTSSIKPVGEGVSEYKIDFGPGYRIYFGKDGDRLVILLGGGTNDRTKILRMPRPHGANTNSLRRMH